MFGAIQWFRFYYARAGRYRIRKRVRVCVTRTRSLGAVCDCHTIRGRTRCTQKSGEWCKSAHGRRLDAKM